MNSAKNNVCRETVKKMHRPRRQEEVGGEQGPEDRGEHLHLGEEPHGLPRGAPAEPQQLEAEGPARLRGVEPAAAVALALRLLGAAVGNLWPRFSCWSFLTASTLSSLAEAPRTQRRGTGATPKARHTTAGTRRRLSAGRYPGQRPSASPRARQASARPARLRWSVSKQWTAS